MNKMLPFKALCSASKLHVKSPNPVLSSTVPHGDGITRVKREKTSSRKNAALKSGEKRRCRSSVQGNLRTEKVRRFGRQQNT